MQWFDWLAFRLVRETSATPTRRRTRLGLHALEERAVPTVSGFVFRDLNGNATRDVGTPQSEPGRTPAIVARTEPGLAGVTVRSFAPGSNTALESVTTAADGSYTLATNLASVRVEFSNLPAGYSFGSSGAQAASSNVRFVNASTNPTGSNLATVIPSQANPYLITPKYTQGNQISGPNAGESVVVGLPYNASGTGTPVSLATASQVGATWAVASNTTTGAVYVGAYMKRYSGFGPNGTGAIYKLQPNYNNLGQLTGSATPVLFADLSVVLGGAAGGAAGTTGANPHPNTFSDGQFTSDNDGNNDGTPDTITNGSIGKIGLGGMVMSPDNQSLYVMNLNTRQLVRLGVDVNGNFNGSHVEFNVPVPAGVAAADVRPFAVQHQNGQVYVGLIDSAETTGVRSNLRGFVYTFNPGAGTFSPSPVLQFQLDYAHGDANIQKTNNAPPNNQPNNGFFQPWDSAIDPSTNGDNYYAQPMLTDLVFDDAGAMIIGIRDREGDQSGPGTTPNQIFGIAGDVLRATPNGSGGFNLEGQTGGPVGTANGEGPGGREFYTDDTYAGIHAETSIGGLAVLPGSGQIVVNSIDPGSSLDSAGPVWMDNTTGRERDNFNVYTNATPATFAKANGLGDLQIVYAPGTLSIGNRVWNDANDNGLQDAGEAGISGVTVQLFQGATQVGATVTNALGEYVFDATNVNNGTPADTTDDGVRPNTAYQIRIATGQGALTGRSPSTPNAGADNIDSDGINNGSTVTFDLTSGPNGTFDDNSDFGFVSRVSLGNLVWNDANNNGIFDNGESGIPNVSVQLLDPTGTTVLQTTSTNASGLYLFTGLTPGTYVVRIPATNFASALSGFSSSTGNPGLATPTPFEGAATPNPNTSVVDNDDNGNTVSGNVVSLAVTVGSSSPTGETPNNDPGTPDAQSNLTVDFGFFQKATITGKVYVDQNANGVIDAADTTGLAGVTIRAVGPTGTFTTTTAADGSYSFVNIPAGSYTVSQPTQPATHNSSTSNTPPAITVPVNGSGVVNFGEYQLTSIAGAVYVDDDNDGVRDAGEAAIPNVTVRLTGTDGAGAAVSLTTTTDASGAYSFTNLVPGNYTVTETQPTAFGDGKDTVGNLGGNNTTNDVLAAIAPTSGQAGTAYNFGERVSIDLAITQQISKTVVNIGETVLITYVVRNNGPSDATGVVMSAPLVSALKFAGTASIQQGTYNGTTGAWTIGPLANGASVTLQIRARVSRAGSFTNPSSVTGNGVETTLANNFANVPIRTLFPPTQVTKRRFLSSSYK